MEIFILYRNSSTVDRKWQDTIAASFSKETLATIQKSCEEYDQKEREWAKQVDDFQHQYFQDNPPPSIERPLIEHPLSDKDLDKLLEKQVKHREKYRKAAVQFLIELGAPNDEKKLQKIIDYYCWPTADVVYKIKPIQVF